MSHISSLTKYVGNFVDQLYQSGVRHIVISPGSRSTPLSLTFAEYNRFQIWVDIDERSAGFFGLGIAKETKEAVVLVCSSGTAAANYFPAIIEAYYSRTPLIVLTADRPHELRDVGAPQAIDQIKLYGNYVNWFHEMALPEETDHVLQYVRNHADRAVKKSTDLVKGPVHLNFPFREPLIPDFSLSDIWGGEDSRFLMHYRANDTRLDKHTLADIYEKLRSKQKGMIVCGPHDSPVLAKHILLLAEAWNIPVLADPLSLLRDIRGGNETVIESYDSILKSSKVRDRLEVDFILRFGAMPVSKSFLQLVQERNIEQFIVDEEISYRNPSINGGAHYIYGEPIAIADQLTQLPLSFDLNWLAFWQDLNRETKDILRSDQSLLTEGTAVQGIQSSIPIKSTLFVGNSMPIRDVDTFWFTSDKEVTIVANRGANGIDGILSTALGTAATGKHVTLLVGDISFLHSINGLLMTQNYDFNLTIVLINNQGGGIFSFLPQAKEDNSHYELLFGTPQNISMEKVAALYEIEFELVTDWTQYQEALNRSYQNGGVSLIEVQTVRNENVSWHQSKWQEVEKNTLTVLEETRDVR
ncbi:2-succinyl-5-enolpyruvyl-6-hydroxy-3-cyclohexene-1-carboxylic-acid synthase [Gracilibacillus boraciitolerans JCM 21714]|uniref:2-succinyl-5-enolpyruvyl-6-hydroxy-3-cyclohexene-1-carboxylate synthase n=1 Tax=Gracilibacillus boraciitolerans JCM 21714 TaxID=1298598 RepID=W4VLD8_9BACI|nr:2-succinyl-5-enolpyruvyl-6-hydroxy-3-cyclohexene-1-carboxylic-acid synthase [Gracilibacillus boraciitolerans]GAE94022.1 2-succinyl-5-enolpyruvyl-6-hydroxy-3-cyclohexene-1-carboxylic-acid synthase [Gracilibacillus boraciitolerans JCM 21714]